MMNYFICKQGILERTSGLSERKIAILLGIPRGAVEEFPRVFRFTADAEERRAWVRDHLLLLMWQRLAGTSGA